MLDIDHFKRFNDRYGHPAGDACLAQVAQALRKSLRRPGDLVARYGGEEFIVVLYKATSDHVAQAAERIRAAVEALDIPTRNPPSICVSRSAWAWPACALMKECIGSSPDPSGRSSPLPGQEPRTEPDLGCGGTSMNQSGALPSGIATAEIDEVLRSRSFWRLTLPGPLEWQFRLHVLARRLQQFQRSGWLALLIFDSFLLVDWLMAPDVLDYSMIVRLGVFTPFGVIALLLVNRFQPLVPQEQASKMVDWMTLISGWGQACAWR